MDNNLVYFNTRDEFVRVDLSMVVYFESDGNYTHIHFRNGIDVMVLTTLANIVTILNKHVASHNTRFVRLGKRHIINTAYVLHINTLKQTLMLTDYVNPNPFVINVSKEALRDLKAAYASSIK